MIRHTFSLFVLAAAAALPARGETTPATDTAGYHLKNRSAFTAPETTRPPFWPVGWVKQQANAGAARVEAAPVVSVTLDPEQFSVTSILLGAPSLAVINGRAYGEGEYLRAPKSKDAKAPAVPPKSIRVAKITDGQVYLQAGGQAVAVPLRRPTLQEHKMEELPTEQ